MGKLIVLGILGAVSVTIGAGTYSTSSNGSQQVTDNSNQVVNTTQNTNVTQATNTTQNTNTCPYFIDEDQDGYCDNGDMHYHNYGGHYYSGHHGGRHHR